MIKTLNELGIEENFLNLIKNTYKNPTACIILGGEKLEAFVLSQGYPLSTPFNIVLEVLANTIRKEKEIKGEQIGKAEIKLTFLTDDNCLCRKSQNVKNVGISDYSKIIRYKFNM